MRADYKKIFVIAVIALATILSAAKNQRDCEQLPALCYPDMCSPCYCLGPENILANAPVNPVTCNGDFVVKVSGLYWSAAEDGLEYGILNSVIGSDGMTANASMNNLIQSEFLSPNFSWDFGFKVGISYNTTCDGWDVGLNWIHFFNQAEDHQEAEFDDNHTILPIWSAFQSPNAGNAPILFATDVETLWNLDLNLLDIELGREFWTSHRLSIRPYVGIRIASINQNYQIMYKGGTWTNIGQPGINFNDYINLNNKFNGTGVLAGLSSTWNLGCGWGVYGNLATSIIYGRFSLNHDENIRLAQSPFTKTRILESKESFHASRAIVDIGLGLKWSSLICSCKYGITVSLGWEQHLFFNQNQLWKVVRLGAQTINPSGENVYDQTRGTLGTKGWTLSGKFEF